MRGGGDVRVIEQCAESERVGHVFSPIAAWIEEAAAVIVAETLGGSGLRERLDNVEHAAYDFVIGGRNFDSISRGQQAGMQKKVERIHVIVERLLEINAVGTNLASGFVQQDLPAVVFPIRRARHLRIKRSDEEERQRFAEQMRVGREIGG